MSKKPFLSLVIPAYNEVRNIRPLYKELVKVCSEERYSYEIIFINDGSSDATQSIIDSIVRSSRKVLGIEFRRNFGKATALRVGFQIAAGDVVATLDADLQDDPKELPKLIGKLLEGYDMVSGWKRRRRDEWYRIMFSRVFNYLQRKLYGLNLHDANSGFKVYHKHVCQNLIIYGRMHRFIPAMLAERGYLLAEVEVNHRRRRFGHSKYSPLTSLNSVFDFFSIFYQTHFKDYAFQFYASVGFFLFSLGGMIGMYLSIQKILFGHPLSERPLLLFAVLLIVLGTQITLFGLLAEQVNVYFDTTKKHSQIVRKISRFPNGSA